MFYTRYTQAITGYTMTLTILLIIVIALGTIISGIMLLKQSAKKFILSDEELEKIKQRNKAQDKKDNDY